jgi:hypothetical protein
VGGGDPEIVRQRRQGDVDDGAVNEGQARSQDRGGKRRTWVWHAPVKLTQAEKQNWIVQNPLAAHR